MLCSLSSSSSNACNSLLQICIFYAHPIYPGLRILNVTFLGSKSRLAIGASDRHALAWKLGPFFNRSVQRACETLRRIFHFTKTTECLKGTYLVSVFSMTSNSVRIFKGCQTKQKSCVRDWIIFCLSVPRSSASFQCFTQIARGMEYRKDWILKLSAVAWELRIDERKMWWL